MGNYHLKCPRCNRNIVDSYTNICPTCGKNSPLLRTEYKDKQFISNKEKGIWKFLNWLPCKKQGLIFEGKTVVYKSHGLANELDLENLYIAFNGYWPEKDANLLTCTFKELEAHPTLQRASERGVEKLVISSAGNTAKAFINSVRNYDIELFVVIPFNFLKNLIIPFEVSNNVNVIAVNGDGDYFDSIAFGEKMSKELRMHNEGGTRNVARRDGLGTVVLESVLHMNEIPDHYFQAVGSGAGAIAAWEASQRLFEDRRFGGNKMKLHLSQNSPFTPMIDAWNVKSKHLSKESKKEQKESISKVYAQVLTNRHPPYSLVGGVYDALEYTDGNMYSISNNEAISAKKKFEYLEGIDIVPAACVCVASLLKAVEKSSIGKRDKILLNITGGGMERLKEDYDMFSLNPNIICNIDTSMQDLKNAIEDVNEHY